MGEGIHSDDKSEIRMAILRGMCRCAEGIEDFYEEDTVNTSIHFLDGCPKAFKPSAADKLLFHRLIDKVIDNIASENRDNTNENMVGALIMATYYYPVYGQFNDYPHK